MPTPRAAAKRSRALTLGEALSRSIRLDALLDNRPARAQPRCASPYSWRSARNRLPTSIEIAASPKGSWRQRLAERFRI